MFNKSFQIKQSKNCISIDLKMDLFLNYDYFFTDVRDIDALKEL